MVTLRKLDNFGDIAAEDDAVLDYFLTTDAVSRMESGDAFVVLGRKGSGKTALVRHFTEGSPVAPSRALNLRGYPWNVHKERKDRGASPIEAYVASWRYLIAVQVAALILERTERPEYTKVRDLQKFFADNYGGPRPKLSDILRPSRLTLNKIWLSPAVLGNSVGGVDLDRSDSDLRLGLELDALSQALLETSSDIARNESLDAINLHFDELDQGLSKLDETRSLMLVGLILACRETRRDCKAMSFAVNPIVYLRTDIWDDLEFSDKNKITQSSAIHLDWNHLALLELVEERLSAKLEKGASWDNINDGELMRGSQPKWSHMMARTFLRPRDVIHFLNVALGGSKKRDEEPLVFTNPDIVAARDEYSTYLKRELDDEILPHWPGWERALQACSAIQTLTFERGQFEKEYASRALDADGMSAGDALSMLYRFSVIGYERRSGYGGTSWAFQYTDPEAGWDNGATKFKVHLGLKEYAKLREARAA